MKSSSPELSSGTQGENRTKSLRRISRKVFPSPPSEVPDSSDKAAPRRSHRTSRSSSPTAKVGTVLPRQRKGLRRQSATPGTNSGATQRDLTGRMATNVDTKVPGTTSLIPSSPLVTPLIVQKGTSPHRASGCRNETTSMASTAANTANDVLPGTGPDSSSVPPIAKLKLGQHQPVQPSPVVTAFETGSHSVDCQHMYANDICDPVSEPKPGQTVTQTLRPRLAKPNLCEDAVTSKGSILLSLHKKLSREFTKKKALGQEAKAPKSPSPSTRSMIGTDYYTTLRELATSIQTDSQTPRTGNSGFLRQRWPPIHVLILSVIVMVAGALVLWRLLASTEKFNINDGTCRTKACYHHAGYFSDSLNYSIDPCVDFGSYVCSKWKPSSDFITKFSGEMIRTHIRRMTNLLLRQENSKFNASAMSAAFLRECVEQPESEENLMKLKRFARDHGIPWPYQNTSGNANTHPLHVVFKLSVDWGIHTWFEVTIRQIDDGGQTTNAWFVDTSEYPSAWLNFIRALKRENARENYYKGFCRLFGSPVPTTAELNKRFDVEESVLSLLHEAALRGRQLLMELTPRELAQMTRNISFKDWLDLAKLRTHAYVDPREVSFFFADKGIILAIDSIFYRHEHWRLLGHLAWWFMQQHAVLGSPSGHILYAGDKQRALRRRDVYCYKIVSGKMGLLLAAESAISLFTAEEREYAWHLLEILVQAAGKFLRQMPWSKIGDFYVASTVAELQLNYWPENLERLDSRLMILYTDFLEEENSSRSFFNYWIHSTNALRSLDYDHYYQLQLSWRAQVRRLFEYDYWSNELEVSHAAFAPPLYYASREGVLRAATFGGFASRFLAKLFRVINVAAFFVEQQKDFISLLSHEGITAFLEFSCGSVYEDRMKDILGVVAAWQLFKRSGSSFVDRDTSLIAIDSRVFTAEEMFFITYCRSLCEVDYTNRCSDILKQVGAFAATFKCKEGMPMKKRYRCGVIRDFEERIHNGSIDSNVKY